MLIIQYKEHCANANVPRIIEVRNIMVTNRQTREIRSQNNISRVPAEKEVILNLTSDAIKQRSACNWVSKVFDMEQNIVHEVDLGKINAHIAGNNQHTSQWPITHKSVIYISCSFDRPVPDAHLLITFFFFKKYTLQLSSIFTWTHTFVHDIKSFSVVPAML